MSRQILIDPDTGEQGVVLEGTSSIIELTFVDRDGSAITAEAFTTLTVTLSNAVDGTIINSRTAQNVLNANNGSLNDATGVFKLKLGPLDNVVVSEATEKGECHYIQFDWTYQDQDTEEMTGQANFQFLVSPDQLGKGTSTTSWLTA